MLRHPRIPRMQHAITRTRAPPGRGPDQRSSITFSTVLRQLPAEPNLTTIRSVPRLCEHALGMQQRRCSGAHLDSDCAHGTESRETGKQIHMLRASPRADQSGAWLSRRVMIGASGENRCTQCADGGLPALSVAPPFVFHMLGLAPSQLRSRRKREKRSLMITTSAGNTPLRFA